MSGNGAAGNIEGFIYVSLNAFHQTAVNFIGQNMGANRPERIKTSIRQGMTISVVMVELFGVFVLLFAPQLVGMFSEDPAVIAYGVQQARIEAPFFFLLAGTHICAGVLRGAGKTMIPMSVTLGAWCVLRIVYIEGLVRIFKDIRVVFTAYPVTWTVSTIILVWFVFRQNWEKNAAAIRKSQVN